jgi:RimJ/RimL family protein N-acetyltransferase
MEKILKVARAEELHRLIAEILPENRPMQHLMKKYGFHLRRDPRGGVVRADLDLYQMA